MAAFEFSSSSDKSYGWSSALYIGAPSQVIYCKVAIILKLIA